MNAADLIPHVLGGANTLFLGGIFWRIGALQAAVRELRDRVARLEGAGAS